MPIGDWQFWVVTALSALGLWKLVRVLAPRRRSGGASCSGCASGSAATRPKRADLTVERRRV